jgi:hypothetical protein
MRITGRSGKKQGVRRGERKTSSSVNGRVNAENARDKQEEPTRVVHLPALGEGPVDGVGHD